MPARSWLLFVATCLSAPLHAQVPFDEAVCTSGGGDAAIASCTRLLQAGSSNLNSAFMYYRRGAAWLGKLEFGKAFADLDEAIRIDPEHADAYASRGDAREQSADLDGAIRDYSEAIRVFSQRDHPYKHAKAYLSRARAWEKKGDLDRAIADYTEALRINPTAIWALHSRALAWAAKGDHDRAAADYGEWMERAKPRPTEDPNLARPMSPSVAEKLRAAILRGSEPDPDGAAVVIASMTERIRINPDDVDSYRQRAISWMERGDLDRAIADFGEALRIGPTFAWIYGERARAWEKKGDLERAIADYGEAIRFGRHPDSYHSRALVWSRRGEHAHAVVDLEAALQLNSQHQGALRSYAWILSTAPDERVRDGARAVALATRACELSNWRNSEAINALAAAHAESGNFAEAVRLQEQALANPFFEKWHGTGARKRLALYKAGKPFRE